METMQLEKKEFYFDHQFNNETCRHTLNDFQTVLHCHHYMTLTTQMAEDAEFLNGTDVLISTMEDTAYTVLNNYYNKHNVTDLWEKISIAEQYFSIWGLGQIKFKHVGEYSATVDVLHSHIDEGWIKKWSKRNKPVNYIGRGYVQAALSLFNNKPPRYYKSEETKSIVKGDPKGEIKLWFDWE